MPDNTKLAMTTIDLPLYSAFDVTQTLTPIQEAGYMARTVNGELLDLSEPAFDKYASSVSCNAFRSPAFGLVRRGQTVVVNCVFELSVAGTLPEDPDDWVSNTRPIVAGSLREKDGFIFYRPALTMKVLNFDIQRDERGAMTGWSIELEEV